VSLLLEALKKAERAKEEAQRQAGNGGAGLELEAAPPAADAKHIFTKDELPSISQTMEITSEGLGEGTPGRSTEPDRAPQSPPPAARASRAQSFEPAPEQRAAAKKVFEAKFREPNPKLAFYIVMGLLGAFAVGTVVYFWLQLRPAPPLVNPNPPRSGSEPPVSVPDAKPAAAPVADAAKAASAPEVAGLPDAKPAASAPAAPPTAASIAAPPAAPASATPATAVPAAPSTAKPTATPTQAGRQVAARPDAAPRQERPPVGVRRAAPSIDPRVDTAYAAYQAGDFAAARREYQRALSADPQSRDALLGMAAVEMRAQNYSASETLYQRLLRIDPRDANAQAGLLALRGQSADPVAAESRVKSMLANDPESGVLNFSLANVYAQQGRWHEAQQAYFKAYTAEPDNPDFAYNLAVSLDYLRQSKLALEYYRRALAGAERRGAAFDPAAAKARVQELSQ